jgi:hypothetical protein
MLRRGWPRSVRVRNSTLGYGLRSLDPPSEHRTIRLTADLPRRSDSSARASQTDNTSWIEAHFHADPNAISGNRFMSLKLCSPFLAAMFKGMDGAARSEWAGAGRWVSGQSFRDTLRERGVSYRKSINDKSFMVESRFCNQASFEQEYEYRCTAYEYDCADDHSTGLRIA